MQISYTIISLTWVTVSYVLYVVLTNFIRAWRHAALARQWSTQDPPVLKSRLPFGVDLVHRVMKSDKEMLFPVDAIARTKEAGAITYKYSTLGSTNIFTADEKNIQAILATQFPDYDLGPLRRGNFFPLLGNGIFTQDGPAWELSRAMMRPQFARELVSDLELEERHVQNLMKAIVTKPGDGWTDEVDLQVLFFRLTLDSATQFLFGKSVDCQLNALPSSNQFTVDQGAEENKFAYAFDKGQAVLATRARLQTFYSLYHPAVFRQCCKDCHEFIDQFVRLALSKDKREKELEKGTGGKEKYVFLEALAQQTRDPIELRSQLLHILLAGRDTTASLLGWLFFCLARDTARYTKLRNIILEEFGTYENPKPITFAKLKSCTYLQHCMNETLRLYPVVAANSRTANKDTTLPRGGGPDGKSKIFIFKGMQVEYSVHVMHLRKDIWGPDAEEFIPERWEGRKCNWEYLPVRIFQFHIIYTMHQDTNAIAVQWRPPHLHRPAIRPHGSWLCHYSSLAALFHDREP
jgi:cytochrome P450